jgi:hypothetical protein
MGYIFRHSFDIPSGKRLHNYGKSPLLVGNGKSTISMDFYGPFSSSQTVVVITRPGKSHYIPLNHHKLPLKSPLKSIKSP